MGARLIPAEALTRVQARSRRKRDVRARTINVTRMTKREIEIGRLLYPEDTAHLRPRTRGECVDEPRPCPFVSCVFHLYLDVDPRTGSIKLNYPDLEPEDMAHSCCLDIADQGGVTLERAGEIMNMTRERIRQIEVKAYTKIWESGIELPHPAEFEHRAEALPDAGPAGAVDDTESVPGKPVHSPVSEAAKHAENAAIMSAENAARGVTRA
jgi:hypothetical protein